MFHGLEYLDKHLNKGGLAHFIPMTWNKRTLKCEVLELIEAQKNIRTIMSCNHMVE